MKIYNSFVIVVASLLLATTVILAASGADSLRTYYTLYVVEALAVAQLFVHFSPEARRGLGFVSAGLFLGFLGIVFSEALRILT